jgi:hypothetical protein
MVAWCCPLMLMRNDGVLILPNAKLTQP